MKSILQAAGFILLFTNAAMAQSDIASLTKKEDKHEKREMKRDNRVVSMQSKEQFMSDFSDVKNVTWKATANFDEATFNNNGTKTTAYYDFESELVGTTVIKSFSDLPAKAQDYIKKRYAGYSTGNVIMFDDNEANETDMILYSTPFDDEDNYFVPLKNNKETIILKVNMEGEVSFFKKV